MMPRKTLDDLYLIAEDDARWRAGRSVQSFDFATVAFAWSAGLALVCVLLAALFGGCA